MSEQYQHPLYPDKETVHFFKQQYKAFEASEEFKEVDELLRGHLPSLNIHDDLATRYCCSGHFDEEDDPRCTERFYILFSCTKHGKEILENIITRFIHEIGHRAAAIKQVEFSSFMDIRYVKPHWCFSIRNTRSSQVETIDLFMRIWNEQIIESLPHFHPLKIGQPL